MHKGLAFCKKKDPLENIRKSARIEKKCSIFSICCYLNELMPGLLEKELEYFAKEIDKSDEEFLDRLPIITVNPENLNEFKLIDYIPKHTEAFFLHFVIVDIENEKTLCNHQFYAKLTNQTEETMVKFDDCVQEMEIKYSIEKFNHVFTRQIEQQISKSNWGNFTLEIQPLLPDSTKIKQYINAQNTDKHINKKSKLQQDFFTFEVNKIH